MFALNFVLKIDDVFIGMKTLYEEGDIILTCSLFEESEVVEFSDIEWILDGEDHPRKETYRNAKILDELQNIATSYGVSLEYIKNFL